MSFPWVQVLPHLTQNKTICRGILGPVVATQGDGPYDEAEFDDFLSACGIQVRFVDDGDTPPSVAIFGREEWVEDDVDTLWEQTSGENVLVYSQELVIASLTIGSSIFDHHDGEITDLIDGHPALERFYLYVPEPASVSYPDPVSTVHEDSHPTLLVSFDTGAWPTSGVLSEMGYRVGKSGLIAAARHKILEDVLTVQLVAASAAANAYVREWGRPASRWRLQKMVNSIAAFARNARRRSADYSEAIADWESDLEWLRVTYGNL